MASEAGNAAAEASIQAFGGYGYTHEYMVEKIKRDVRITTTYEGSSRRVSAASVVRTAGCVMAV